MKRVISAAVAAAFLLGVSACGDDDKSSNPLVSDANGSDDTSSDNGSGDNGSGGVTIPNINGLDAGCLALAQAMGAAGSAVSGQGDAAEWEAMMTALAASVPDDLKDDALIFGEAYSEFLAVVAQHEGQANAMADPAVMAAMQAISTPEVQAAAENISNYMDTTCPGT